MFGKRISVKLKQYEALSDCSLGQSDQFHTACFKTGFQVGPTFPIFPTIPYFFDPLLLFPTFHENALLSLLFLSKMTSTRKNPENFPRSLRSLRFYKLTSMFIQGARSLTPQNFMFYLIKSLCLASTNVTGIILLT